MPLEELLIHHCAPTLAGLKEASLFRYRPQSGHSLDEELPPLTAALQRRGISCLLLRRCPDGGGLLYLYRPSQLEPLLQQPQQQQFLHACGYPSGLLPCLRELSRRLSLANAFPHEIGVFLGYPLEDVLGFIRHGGRQYRLSGCWKVYGDAAAAQARFRRYAACTRALLHQYHRGIPLASLTTEI